MINRTRRKNGHHLVVNHIVHCDTCDLSRTFLHGVKLGPERSSTRCVSAGLGHTVMLPGHLRLKNFIRFFQNYYLITVLENLLLVAKVRY